MSTEVKLSLAHKKNLKDHEAAKAALLAKLKDITGHEYTFEITPSFEEIIPKVHKAGVYPRDHEKIGEIFYGKEGYLHFIVQKFEENCKDEMVKEALLDATSARKILFTVREARDNTVPKMTFDNGVFGVGTSADRFGGEKKYICEGDITKIL